MLILAIILLVLGLVVFQWNANALSQPFYARPMIFNSVVAVLIINLIWIGLFGGALYSFWRVNPVIDFVLIGIFAVLWVAGSIMGSEKAKATKIFKIYKQAKLFRPEATDEEIFRETAQLYFQSLRWDEYKIQSSLNTIFDDRMSTGKEKDIKEIASSILILENPNADSDSPLDFKAFSKRYDKKRKALDSAYAVVFGNGEKITKCPELSANTTKWVKSIGLDPTEMSNEQLAVFAEIDDSKKSNWLVRFFYGVSAVFLLLAGINLFTLEIGGVVSSALISFVVWFVGYKIQMRRVSKKFYEASIAKFAQERAQSAQKSSSHV